MFLYSAFASSRSHQLPPMCLSISPQSSNVMRGRYLFYRILNFALCHFAISLQKVGAATKGRKVDAFFSCILSGMFHVALSLRHMLCCIGCWTTTFILSIKRATQPRTPLGRNVLPKLRVDVCARLSPHRDPVPLSLGMSTLHGMLDNLLYPIPTKG